MSFITWEVGILEAPGSQELLDSHFGFSSNLLKVQTNVLTPVSNSYVGRIGASSSWVGFTGKAFGCPAAGAGGNHVGGGF